MSFSTDSHLRTLQTPNFAHPAMLYSDRGFLCEGPDSVIRRFLWRRNCEDGYDVSHILCLVTTRSGTLSFCYATGIVGRSRILLTFLQLYAIHDNEVLIGLFRKHQPPEMLEVGDNYATFYFRFSHQPLLLHALLALSLNRWLDSQAGTQ
jgi:hypothetical protein